MCDVKPMLLQLIHTGCEIRHLVGSPSYGVLKYEIPECDLIILKRRVRVPMGEKIRKFGMSLRHGGNWCEWEISHATCVAQVQRLESFGVQNGRYVHDYYVDRDSLSDGMIPEHVEWVGDIQVLLDALTYLLMVSQ
jgi:hypothetical protein